MFTLVYYLYFCFLFYYEGFVPLCVSSCATFSSCIYLGVLSQPSLCTLVLVVPCCACLPSFLYLSRTPLCFLCLSFALDFELLDVPWLDCVCWLHIFPSFDFCLLFYFGFGPSLDGVSEPSYALSMLCIWAPNSALSVTWSNLTVRSDLTWTKWINLFCAIFFNPMNLAMVKLLHVYFSLPLWGEPRFCINANEEPLGDLRKEVL